MPSVNDITYETPPQPRQLRLDTTTRCQASCLSCHRQLTNRTGEMDIQMISQILDDASKLPEPLVEIVPVNYGEFFMRKEGLRILQLIERKLPNTMIVIPTNGALLDGTAVNELCEIQNITLINFSINAFFDETYEQFVGLKAKTMEKISQSIKHISMLRPEILLVASMVFDPEYQTDLEKEKFTEYWEGKATVFITVAASAGRNRKPLKPVKIPCRSIFADLVIGFDGKLSSCCFDADFSGFDLGSYSGDLKADWNSKQFQRFRYMHNAHRRNEIGLCSACTFA